MHRGPLLSASVLAATMLAASTPAVAQFDPSGSWRTFHTAHFRVHAKEPLADVAREAAREAERAYELLARELVPPRPPIDLVVADNHDLSNGFATPFPSNRFAIYVAPPTQESSLNDYDSWLRLVITHELTHVFHIDRAEGLWGGLQSAFGRAPILFPNAYQPPWVAEGIATYYESRFTRGGRIHGAFHRQILTAAATRGNWQGIGDASVASLRWPGGFRPYAWGAELFQRASAAHGDTVVPAFVKRTSRQLIPLRVSGPLKGATGRSLSEAWRSMRREFEGMIERPEAAGASGKVIIESALRSEPHPRVSPDGTLLAYVRVDNRSEPHVVVRRVADLGVVATRRVNGRVNLAWSGSELLVSQLDFTSPVEMRSDLYGWDLRGSWRRLTHGARVSEPFATPEGLAGVVDVASGSRELRYYPEHGGAPLPFPAPEATAWSRVEVSPDGRRVAGVRHWNGRWDVVMWSPERPREVRQVTDDQALDEDVAWSADGTLLLFASEREGLPQVYALDVRRDRLVRLTDEPTGAREPAPVAGGGLVYWTMEKDGMALVLDHMVTPRPARPQRDPPPPLEPAPEVEIRETGYAAGAGLVPRWWLPWSHHEGATGTFLGATTSGIDAIGRLGYAIGATVAVDTLNFRWEGALLARYQRFKSVAVDVGLSQTWARAGTLSSPVDGTQKLQLGERERRAEVGVTWQALTWRRTLALRVGGELEDNALVDAEKGDVRSRIRLGGPILALTAGAFSHPPLALSREDGVVVRTALGRRWVLDGGGRSNELRGSVAGYLGLPLPGFAHWVLALQLAAARGSGSVPHKYSLGGTLPDEFDVFGGLSGFGSRRFPLRGYDHIGRYTRVVTGVAELRVPLLLIGRGLRYFPVGVEKISLTAFGEIGGGWEPGEAAALPFRDVGAELVTDFLLGAVGWLRVRWGGAMALADAPGDAPGTLSGRRHDVRWYVVVAPSF